LANKLIFYIEKVYFWPSNYRVALVSTIELKKPEIFDHHTLQTKHKWSPHPFYTGFNHLPCQHAYSDLADQNRDGGSGDRRVPTFEEPYGGRECTLVAPTTSAQ